MYQVLLPSASVPAHHVLLNYPQFPTAGTLSCNDWPWQGFLCCRYMVQDWHPLPSTRAFNRVVRGMLGTRAARRLPSSGAGQLLHAIAQLQLSVEPALQRRPGLHWLHIVHWSWPCLALSCAWHQPGLWFRTGLCCDECFEKVNTRVNCLYLNVLCEVARKFSRGWGLQWWHFSEPSHCFPVSVDVSLADEWQELIRYQVLNSGHTQADVQYQGFYWIAVL
jgi:hypothetical protein